MHSSTSKFKLELKVKMVNKVRD